MSLNYFRSASACWLIAEHYIWACRSLNSIPFHQQPDFRGQVANISSKSCAHLGAAAHRCSEEGAASKTADVEVRPEANLRHGVQPDVQGVLLLQLGLLLLLGSAQTVFQLRVKGAGRPNEGQLEFERPPSRGLAGREDQATPHLFLWTRAAENGVIVRIDCLQSGVWL